MANPEHVDILRQGVEVWNAWRKRHHEIQPDLSGADLSRVILIAANLSNANLSRADLSHANLFCADLSHANLFHADLSRAALLGTNLSGTTLSGADLSRAFLIGAILSDADLSGAILTSATLGSTVLSGVSMGQTILNDVDLRGAKGLEWVVHRAPSGITTSTLERSQGDIPEAFLRGVGLSDTFITSLSSLVTKTIEYYTCFISYSSHDQDFAEQVYADL